ncbi:efflux RND transporter permease subunit [Thermosynechococcus sp. HY213]|uniref:efflux RND transporter permease subunit n=1 Tax=Thermosynechococcus sp. HY213 TaxID=3074104 RepID=UPI002865F50D|nr:efflux RND transporter permease subunit [Thermosynechococcus sp. HY213]MDR7922403.1 efflux RND transporter permease subunit [Thermosynechococcus sp. HY213]
MLNRILGWSIVQRWLVVLGAIALTIFGIFQLRQMPLDVLPEFAPPPVEIQTEAPGLAREEVESLITLPIESVVNGTAGVETVRSASSLGLSVVKVVFSWQTNIYQARQLITERLQEVRDRLPPNASPQISPITSPIATILMYALAPKVPTAPDDTSLMELRQLVDQKVVNRLLAVPGVSQVIAYGGDVPQYQVLVHPDRLAAQQVSLQDVVAGVSGANENAAGGVIVTPDQELIVRGIGRATSVADLAVALVAHRNGQPIRVQDVATVTKGPALARGDGSVNGQRAIILILTSISKRGKTIFPWVLLPLLLILKRQRAIGSLYR